MAWYRCHILVRSTCKYEVKDIYPISFKHTKLLLIQYKYKYY